MMKNATLLLIGGVSLAALASPACAQQASAAAAPQSGSTDQDATATQAMPGDIIVTAQRRSESVVQVPISVTVADQAQLERQQVDTVNDLNRIAPSLEIQAAPGQNTGGGGSIRGIGTQTFSAGAVASVGIVVDQVSQGNANISDLFDVARVEVLKGPQGTLFGLTTSAGVINITTNAPDPTEWSARIRTELSANGVAGSKFGNQIIQGVINMPLAQNAALRLSGSANLRQGVDRNAVTGDWNDEDHYSARGRFLWTPTDRLTINLLGDYSHSRQTGGGDFFTFVRASGPGIIPLPGPPGAPPLSDDIGIAARLASCGVTVGEGNQDYCAAAPITSKTDNYGGSFQMEYRADPFTLTSITSYRRSVSNAGDPQNIFRADPLPLQILQGTPDSSIDLFTQEFRVSSPSNVPFEYTAGFFYSDQISNTQAQTFQISLTPFPGLTIPIENAPGAINRVTDESLAVFGEGTLHLNDKLRLIAGGRYTAGRLALKSYDLASQTLERQRLVTDAISYRFGAQYDLMPRTMAYVTVSRGYKGGQIAVPALPQLPFIVYPERPTDYEAGIKSTLFGGLIMDLNGFYEKVHDYQSQQCTTDPTTAAISCVQTNIDQVVSKGGEINFFGHVGRNLSLNTGFIYTHVTYPKNFVGTDGTDIGGKQLTYSPRYKFTFAGEYDLPVSSRFGAFLASDAVWKSRIAYEANSISQSTFRPHWIVGGRVGVRTADGRYELAVFARNLFNVHEPLLMQSGFPYGGGADLSPAANVGAIYGPQSFRQIGLQLDGKF